MTPTTPQAISWTPINTAPTVNLDGLAERFRAYASTLSTAIQSDALMPYTRSVEIVSALIERSPSLQRTLSVSVSLIIDHPASTADSLAKRPRWKNQEYRQAYMEAAIEQGIAWQIKVNRERRQWSQKDLARLIDTRQSAISRAEDPEYGRHRIETLTKIANAFDCALQVRFVPYSSLARDSADLSQDTLYAPSFDEECHHEENRHESGTLPSQRALASQHHPRP